MSVIGNRESGVALLEGILALALFASVATAMTVALDRLGSSSVSIQRELILLRKLDSALAEASQPWNLQSGTHLSEPDSHGIRVRTEVRPISLENPGKEPLRGIHQVRVTASWGGDLERSLEVLVLDPETAR